MILRDKVIRLRAPQLTDEYGNESRDWTAATSAEMRVSIQPASTDENVVDQQRTDSKWRLIAHPGADIEATDRFEWAGQTFEVDGEVQPVHRRGRPHHVTAPLSRVEQG